MNEQERGQQGEIGCERERETQTQREIERKGERVGGEERRENGERDGQSKSAKCLNASERVGKRASERKGEDDREDTPDYKPRLGVESGQHLTKPHGKNAHSKEKNKATK